MKVSVLFCLLLILSVVFSTAQPVTIHGNAPDYGGIELIFSTYSDLISFEERELARCSVAEDGEFSVTFEIGYPASIYSYFGVYKGGMYVLPGSNYNIILPPRQEKTQGDILNPYFRPLEIRFGIKDISSLDPNVYIPRFEEFYDDIITSELALKRENWKQLDETIARIDSLFLDGDTPFFRDYRYYRWASLRYTAYARNFDNMAKIYFHNKPVQIHNMAYMDFFNQLFEDFFSSYSQTVDGTDIIDDIAKAKSPAAIKKSIGKNMALNDKNLKELLILKGLHDSFFPKRAGIGVVFPKKQLLQTLDSAIILAPDPELKNIAQNIKSKVSYLSRGTEPPSFTLPNEKGKEVSLNDLQGKYVYLAFFNSNSVQCRQELDLLLSIHEKYKRALRIVAVFTDDDFEKTKEYMQSIKAPFTYLHLGNQNELLKKYRVKVYPTYYLIDPEGKLTLSPAPSPGESFDQYFMKELKSTSH